MSLGNLIHAFSCCDLSYLIIPDTLRKVDEKAFSVTEEDIKAIYYEGTPAQWSTIYFNENTPVIPSIQRYYYSETQPTTQGNYWRYVNGVPTAW
jgi:hypothetical protein